MAAASFVPSRVFFFYLFFFFSPRSFPLFLCRCFGVPGVKIGVELGVKMKANAKGDIWYAGDSEGKWK